MRQSGAGAQPKRATSILKMGFLMTDFLPALSWKPSPNFSSRRGARVDLIVLHDCEGGYEGSVEWFSMRQSNVSAHLVVREDGSEERHVVNVADNAWHACAFNRRSIGVEMSGFASHGFGAPLLATAAHISAYYCHHLQIPVRHARSWRRTRHRLASRSRPRGGQPSRSVGRPGVHGDLHSDGR